MDLEASFRIQRRGLSDFLRFLGSSSPGAGLYEGDGVFGAIVPACPERGLINSMVYEDPADLAEQLGAIESAYAEAGVNARIVWVPEFDAEAVAVLEAAGYRYDGAPVAMHADLADLPEADVGDLDWDTDATPAEIGRVNDRAYGLPPKEGFTQAITTPAPIAGLRFYRARADGDTACIVGTMDHGSDLGIYFVATLPEFRGRGLTTRLMQVALAEGRERGLATTSLQASQMGEPIYERMGYRKTFRLELWEHRVRRES